MAAQLEDLEKRYEAQFRVVLDAIRQLLAPPEKTRRSIGFRVEDAALRYRIRRSARRGK